MDGIVVKIKFGFMHNISNSDSNKLSSFTHKRSLEVSSLGLVEWAHRFIRKTPSSSLLCHSLPSCSQIATQAPAITSFQAVDEGLEEGSVL